MNLARQAVFDCFKMFCSPVRRHGDHGKKPPDQFEQPFPEAKRSVREIDGDPTCHDTLLPDKRWTNKLWQMKADFAGFRQVVEAEGRYLVGVRGFEPPASTSRT